MNTSTKISVLVLTYRRPDKLKRLLTQFTLPEMQAVRDCIEEIVVADDCGKDDTGAVIAPVLKDLGNLGYAARYVCRERNLRGDMNLYKGYRDDCEAEYVWILCDDDVLMPAESAAFVRSVVDHKPAVAICQFAQGEGHKYGTKFTGQSRRVIDAESAVEMIARFPKTSAYILKRDLISDFDREIHGWNGTLFSWIGMSIMLFAKYPDRGLYIHTPLTMVGDDGYSSLRYSYRVFQHLGRVVAHAVDKSNLAFGSQLPKMSRSERSELNWCLRGLFSHFNPLSPVRYEDGIAAAEFKFLTHKISVSMTSTFKHLAKRINTVMRSVGIDLASMMAAAMGLPHYVRNLFRVALTKRQAWPLLLTPTLSDRYKSAGVANGHYFHMDLWAARKVRSLNPRSLVDVGSRVDGFVSHILSFRDIEVFDIRDLQSKVDGLTFKRFNVMNTEDVPKDYADCVSSLHAIEHFGLGRYGDPVDVEGWKKGIQSLVKILKTDGVLLLAVPISGAQRIEFDAHRVFHVDTVIEHCAVQGLALTDFAYVDDQGDMSTAELPLDLSTKRRLSDLNYGCGCFIFRKIR
jgi:glycosyltransferase involved in cell wall biosynthesis/SAM-dependent methyltransferase